MTRTGVLQEIRQRRFEELDERRRGRRLTPEEAAEILGVDVRPFRRWSWRYEAPGAEGLADRRLGRLSGRRAPVDQVMQRLGLFETRYRGFTVKPFHEKLLELRARGAHCGPWRYRALSPPGAADPPGPYRCHCVKAKVRGHTYLEGTLAAMMPRDTCSLLPRQPQCKARFPLLGGLVLKLLQRTDNGLPKPDKLTCFLHPHVLFHPRPPRRGG
jgi:hypothetical protein